MQSQDNCNVSVHCKMETDRKLRFNSLLFQLCCALCNPLLNRALFARLPLSFRSCRLCTLVACAAFLAAAASFLWGAASSKCESVTATLCMLTTFADIKMIVRLIHQWLLYFCRISLLLHRKRFDSPCPSGRTQLSKQHAAYTTIAANIHGSMAGASVHGRRYILQQHTRAFSVQLAS